ncbi:hypothetical protein AB0N88_27845 [Streptomyces sp. NPDC093516]|uniref:hypothetical protein n=1 Tax=Streptomyces sp. NPDC093516 TaxID=3155304 RepID=UPI00344683E1
MRGDRVEMAVDAGDATRACEGVASRAGRGVARAVRRGVVEVSEVTRGEPLTPRRQGGKAVVVRRGAWRTGVPTPAGEPVPQEKSPEEAG